MRTLAVSNVMKEWLVRSARMGSNDEARTALNAHGLTFDLGALARMPRADAIQACFPSRARNRRGALSPLSPEPAERGPHRLKGVDDVAREGRAVEPPDSRAADRGQKNHPHG